MSSRIFAHQPISYSEINDEKANNIFPLLPAAPFDCVEFKEIVFRSDFHLCYIELPSVSPHAFNHFSSRRRTREPLLDGSPAGAAGLYRVYGRGRRAGA